MKSRIISVDNLARVEGEGALYVKIRDNAVVDVKLKIFEPPRFFEAFLRGRPYSDAPDFTSRICGICPIAYQMSAVQAIEDAFGISVGGQLRALRRLIYCGEWIESHALHVYMLHAPDFLGYADALRMSKDYPEIVKDGLQLKKIGNEIVSLIGGREIHPINVRVGGFYKVPSKKEMEPLIKKLTWARETALKTVKWVSTLPFPEFDQDYEFISLCHAHEYPLNEGRIISNKGLNITVREYDDHFTEEHAPYTNALQSVLKERGSYVVGPLARYNLNFDRLSPRARQAAESAGLGPTCSNPFKSIIVRSVEILYACDEAIRLIEAYETPERSSVDVQPRAATGYGCTEAPRGLLYHRYTFDGEGEILDTAIIPPTSQNQKTIENDLYHFIPALLDLPDDQLTWQCEQAIRNYDPCISCATHFLKVTIETVSG
jgi:sulfhydrogenase subunit alpha